MSLSGNWRGGSGSFFSRVREEGASRLGLGSPPLSAESVLATSKSEGGRFLKKAERFLSEELSLGKKGKGCLS